MTQPSSQTPLGIGDLAAEVLLGKLNQHEEGGRNRGPVVEWSCKRWIVRSKDPERRAEQEKEYERLLEAGELEWCAGAGCSAFDDAGSTAIKDVVSLRCTPLLERCRKKGWSVPREEARRGYLLFTDRDGNGKPNHVGIINKVHFATRKVQTVSGNTGAGSIQVGLNEYDLDDRKILAIIRIPA